MMLRDRTWWWAPDPLTGALLAGCVLTWIFLVGVTVGSSPWGIEETEVPHRFAHPPLAFQLVRSREARPHGLLLPGFVDRVAPGGQYRPPR